MTTGENNQWRVAMAESGLSMLFAKIIVWFGLLCTLGFAYPWLKNWYNHKWIGRLVIDGRHVRYTGNVAGILVTWLKTWFLSLITVSLYWWLRGSRNIMRYCDAHIEWA